MTVKFFNITNHALSDEQRAAAQYDYGESAGDREVEVINMPPEIAGAWASVPPTADTVAPYVSAAFEWVIASRGDADCTALVQGESGAVFWLVQKLMTIGVRCVHATTRRESAEVPKPDGSVEKRTVFQHVRFREYERA